MGVGVYETDGATGLGSLPMQDGPMGSDLAVSRMVRFPASTAPRICGGRRECWSCMREMSGEMTTTRLDLGCRAAAIW